MATVFIREWRYLEGERREQIVAERRRYEERLRALFREGREHGELRTDLDESAAALLVLSAANWAYTWLTPGPRHGRAGRLVRRDPRRRDPRLLDAHVTHDPDRQPVREPRHARARGARSRAPSAPRRRSSPSGPGTRPSSTRDADTDAVVVFSGDGGFNEALNGVARRDDARLRPRRRHERAPARAGAAARPASQPRARSRRAGRGRISLGRANGRRFGFAAGVGLDAELIRRMDARGRDENGKRPGDLAFAWTAVQALAAHRVRFEPALEVVGHGRAAFALVANADPYSYVGRLPLRLPRGAQHRGRPRPARAAVAAARGACRVRCATSSPAGPACRWSLLHDSDRDRGPLRRPMPLQLDGEDVGDVTEVVFEAERDAVSRPRL